MHADRRGTDLVEKLALASCKTQSWRRVFHAWSTSMRARLSHDEKEIGTANQPGFIPH
jgi:hypothetical protein